MDNKLWGEGKKEERKGVGMNRALHRPAIKESGYLPRTHQFWRASAEIWTFLDRIEETNSE